MVTSLPVVFVYTSVMFASLAVVRLAPAATEPWLLEATVYVYVSKVPATNASKL